MTGVSFPLLSTLFSINREVCEVSADIDDSLGWSLPTGFETPITYFYIAYFVVLLLHRQHRDDHACKEKYGADWDEVSLHVYKYTTPAKTVRHIERGKNNGWQMLMQLSIAEGYLTRLSNTS